MKKKLLLSCLLTLVGIFSISSCGDEPFPNNGDPQIHHGDHSGSDTTPTGGGDPAPSGGGEVTPTGGDEDEPTGGNTQPGGDEDEPGEEIIPEEKEEYFGSKNNRILHCFDWTISNIRNNLHTIKNSGFNMIQLSPMQPQKDPQSGNWRGQWWKLYQPLGFSIASTNQNKLGNKYELQELCNEAEELGIDVIVDVVANHLASENTQLSSAVKNFEPTIYNGNYLHNLGVSIDDNVTKGNMGGLCDLKTEDTYIQSRVLSLLKEYVDVGVDGFRFDAAKHIETEYDDVSIRSDFWKNTLDVAKEYYKSKTNKDMFSYGEILGTPGSGREYSYYTSRMGITDSEQSSVLLNVAKGNEYKITDVYDTGVNPSKLVIWAESHDTYSNDWGETKDVELFDINRGYLMQASRKDSSVLYFARPNNSTNIGDIGDTSCFSSDTKAINLFKLINQDRDETVLRKNGCFVNVRGNKSAVIVRISEDYQTSIEVGSLENGNYKDLITDTKYVVSNGRINISATTNAVVLIKEDEKLPVPPSILDVTYSEVYKDSQTINVSSFNADKLTYSVNNSGEVEITGSSFTLPSSIPNGFVSLIIKASNEYGEEKREYRLVKTSSLVNKSLIIANIDNNYDYRLWVWKDNNAGSWLTPQDEDKMIGVDMGNNNMFIVVKFKKNETNIDWSTKVDQTENISFTKRVFDYSEFTIKK